MTTRVLQVNFSFSCTPEELGRDLAPLVDSVSRAPGMVWKVWLIDAEARRGGGIHLFERNEDMQAYVQGDIIAGLQRHPAISQIDMQQFDVLEDFSRMTRAPLSTRSFAAV